MGFQNSSEVSRYIGGIFEEAFNDPEIGPRLTATGIVLRFAFSEPDTVLVVDMGGGTVGDGSGQPEPTATMVMKAAVGNAYWQGQVNLPLAMAKNRIAVQGNVAALLKLAPLSKKLIPVYVQALRRDGRDDLLV
jgi:hypothetical protein